IERNFMHHNRRWGGGYGSLSNHGGRMVVLGNTFLGNRHSIASDGEPNSEYRAWYNLMLSTVPIYSVVQGGAQQDFDMHGWPTGYGSGSKYGTEPAGSMVDIAGNTFLGGNRFNFELRGLPCVLTDFFRDNVTQRNKNSDLLGQGSAIN